MSLVYVIEDNPMMAECIAMAVRSREQLEPDGQLRKPGAMIFQDAITALKNLDRRPPDMILLDVLLTGPDGFAFLNELVSYNDTARIPVVLITSLDLSGRGLEHYGVIGILSKSTMTPEDIRAAVATGLAQKYALVSSEPGLAGFASESPSPEPGPLSSEPSGDSANVAPETQLDPSTDNHAQ